MAGYLMPAGEVPIPPAARDLYLRDPEVAQPEAAVAVELDAAREATVLAEYRDLLGVFLYEVDVPGEDRWGWWSKVWRRIGTEWRLLLRGDCDDFAVEMLRRLKRAGFPRGALRLAICLLWRGSEPTPHMVLTVETDRGTLVVCNLAGVCWLGSPRLAAHRFVKREKPTAVRILWESVKTTTLEDVLRGHAQA